jgi:hypothetical protein
VPFPVAERFVTETEGALGRRLPEAWRQRLMAQNGGIARARLESWDLYKIRDTTDVRRLKRSMSHVLRETELNRDQEHFPRDGIALASNGGGDQLVLLGTGDQVYFWSHESGELEPVEVDLGL